MNFKVVAIGLTGIAGAAAIFFLVFANSAKISETDTFAAPGLDPMTVDEARAEFWRLTPALLLEVYDAFGKTEEDTIYDTLANVTHGGALEYLYLERVGAMSGGGLEEADQEIHEIKMLTTRSQLDGTNLNVDASWQVIGTVGHAEHLHVRGNTYSAKLTISPIEGAWRITDFDLLDVSREMAGETFLAPDVN